LSSLITLENQIHVKDIILPKGVALITGLDEVVALVAEVKEEAVEEAPVDLSAIEVERKVRKKKKEKKLLQQKQQNNIIKYKNSSRNFERNFYML